MAFVETWTGQHEGRRRARPVDTNTETQEPNHQRPANSGSTVNVTGELASGGRPHDVACRQARFHFAFKQPHRSRDPPATGQNDVCRWMHLTLKKLYESQLQEDLQLPVARDRGVCGRDQKKRS